MYYQTLRGIDQYIVNLSVEPLHDRVVEMGDMMYGPQLRDAIRPASEGDSSIDQQEEEIEVYFPTVKQVLEYLINPQSAVCKSSDTILIPYSYAGLLTSNLRLSSAALTQCQYQSQKYIKILNFNAKHKEEIQNLRIKQGMPYNYINPIPFSQKHVVLRNIGENTRYQHLKQRIREISNVEVKGWSGLHQIRQTWNSVIELESLDDAVNVCEKMDWVFVFNEFEIVKANLIPPR